MRRSLAILLFAGLAAMFQSGCGSGGSGGGGAPCCTLAVYTEQAGGGGVWANASVYGNADPGEAPCDPTTDTYCYLTFPASATTNTYGEYTFSTDALPDSWSVGATGDSTCPNGGSSNGTITNDGSVYVYCNSFTVGTAVAAPDNCTITINENPGGGETNNCPSTITVTTSESELPTSYAVNVANYDDTASEENASQITPSSSTSIVVPTPNAVGENAVIIVDPTTNQVIATASFLIHMQIILPGK